ncbi:STAS domain-containing protein [Actinoplanes sp. NPDC023714]|uniref:STAS domain-containing protein n=1 Tax=Actinoplanes sp. NPDC023714 TaxID=3154322 RepID=UPI0033F1A806
MKIVRHDTTTGTVRLVLTGDLDMATAGDLDEHVAAVLAGPPPGSLVVEAAGVEFCDSSGIHALLRSREACRRRGVSFVVTEPVGITRRTLEIAGLLDVLTAPSLPT